MACAKLWLDLIKFFHVNGKTYFYKICSLSLSDMTPGLVPPWQISVIDFISQLYLPTLPCYYNIETQAPNSLLVFIMKLIWCFCCTRLYQYKSIAWQTRIQKGYIFGNVFYFEPCYTCTAQVINSYKHIGAWTEWPSFCKQHSEINFLERKYMHFDINFTKVCSSGCN